MGQEAGHLGAGKIVKKVFIIHGWTYTLTMWTELCELLRTEGVIVKQLQVPGLTTDSDKAWDINGYVTWLRKELRGETKPIVIGHSNGGRIALNFASRYPDTLGELILIDSAGIYHGGSMSKTKRGIYKILAKIGKPLTVIPGVKKIFYKVIGSKDYYQAPVHMKETMKNMLSADKILNLANVRVPVQLIWGQQDKSTPLADAYKLQIKLHNAPLTIIKGAGHSPHSSHPHEVFEIIVKSLKVEGK